MKRTQPCPIDGAQICGCPVCTIARESDELDQLARRVARSVGAALRAEYDAVDLRDAIRRDEPVRIG